MCLTPSEKYSKIENGPNRGKNGAEIKLRQRQKNDLKCTKLRAEIVLKIIKTKGKFRRLKKGVGKICRKSGLFFDSDPRPLQFVVSTNFGVDNRL